MFVINEKTLSSEELQSQVKDLGTLILDSSLKSRTIPKKDYDIKCVQCGEYRQYFKTNIVNTHSEKGWEKDKNEIKNKKVFEIIKNIENDDLFDKEVKILKEPTIKQIEQKNIVRSKNNMCRLILANECVFKTFITLTFREKVKDIEVANYEFQKFIRKIKRGFPDLLYIAVPEFQKNERIHYHLITNIDYNNDFLINENIALKELYQKIGNKANIEEYKEENIVLNEEEHMNDRKIVLRFQDGEWHNTKKTFNHKTNSYKIFKTIKYWNNGFSNVMKLDLLCGNNIAGYMAKYMMKDLDNRLFGKKRYFFSQNLVKPQIFYLNSNDKMDLFIFENDLKTSELKFSKNYKDKFENDIEFYEIKSSNGFINYFNN